MGDGDSTKTRIRLACKAAYHTWRRWRPWGPFMAHKCVLALMAHLDPEPLGPRMGPFEPSLDPRMGPASLDHRPPSLDSPMGHFEPSLLDLVEDPLMALPGLCSLYGPHLAPHEGPCEGPDGSLLAIYLESLSMLMAASRSFYHAGHTSPIYPI